MSYITDSFKFFIQVQPQNFINILEMFKVLFTVFVSVVLSKSNGWNDKIDWQPSLEATLSKVKESGKPGMIVIHKSWCGACKALKPKFAESSSIEQLSENFVMYNALDDDEPKGEEFKPDGGYIPRMVIFSKTNFPFPKSILEVSKN